MRGPGAGLPERCEAAWGHPPAAAAVRGRAGPGPPQPVRVLSHLPADRSAAPTLGPDDTAFWFGLFYFFAVPCNLWIGIGEWN